MTLVDHVIGKLHELSGVVSVGIDSNLPLSGMPREPYEITRDGQSAADREQNPFVHLHVINDEYFPAMRATLMPRPFGFERTDTAETQNVVIISQSVADRLFPGRDPIGQRIALGNPAVKTSWSTIVGIAAPVKLHHLSSAGHLDVYRPYRQQWWNGFWFTVRTRGIDPSTLITVAPPLVTAFDPNQSYFDVEVMTDRVASSIWQQRVSGALFAAFGGLAFTLAVIGLYGVLSFLVTQQRREIGVRMALGADPASVRAMVVGRGPHAVGDRRRHRRRRPGVAWRARGSVALVRRVRPRSLDLYRRANRHSPYRADRLLAAGRARDARRSHDCLPRRLTRRFRGPALHLEQPGHLREQLPRDGRGRGVEAEPRHG